jgi:DNA-binding LytR/AlgR family response regulator
VTKGDSGVINQASPAGLDRYLRHRPFYSAALLITLLVVGGVGSVITQIADVETWGLAIETWELVVWESTSRSVVLALIPAMLAFDRYVPLGWRNLRRSLPAHLLASVVFSVIHVQLMLLLRKLAYSAVDRHYVFNDWMAQQLYEYLKDVRTYFGLLFIIYAYRFILLRLQGEASELGASDAKSQVEPGNYPDRFLVRKLDKEFLIAANEIERLEAQGNYVYLRVDGCAYPLRSTMAAIETRLDPSKFVRVHRSHIVNTDFLVAIEPMDSGDAKLKMRDGTSVPCSRTYRAALKERVT